MTSRLRELLLMMEEEPSDPFLKYVYALELEKSGLLLEAVTAMQELLAAHSDYLAAYYQAGRLLDLTGESEAAVLVISKGIALAHQQNNRHTLAELKFMLAEITGRDE